MLSHDQCGTLESFTPFDPDRDIVRETAKPPPFYFESAAAAAAKRETNRFEFQATSSTMNSAANKSVR